MRISKYDIYPGAFRSTIPTDAKVISFAFDARGVPCMWAIIDPRTTYDELSARSQSTPELDPAGPRTFYVAMTGEPLPPRATAETFIGTVVGDHGMVLHLFELTEEDEL